MCVFPSEKPYFSQNHHVAKNLILGSILEPFWYHFSIILVSFFDLFSTSIFASIFYRFFLIFGPKMGPKIEGGRRFLAPFFATFSEARFFHVFWSFLGSILAPFWSLLVPFGSLWLPLGSFLFTFRCLLAPFWFLLVPVRFLLLHFVVFVQPLCLLGCSIPSVYVQNTIRRNS